jgi:cell shape-determining protein MreC
MRKTFSLIVAASLCLPCLNTCAQDISDPVNKVINIPSRYISKIQNKFSHLDQQLSRQTEKYLKRLEKQEAKLSQAVSKYNAKATVHPGDGQKPFKFRLGYNF